MHALLALMLVALPAAWSKTFDELMTEIDRNLTFDSQEAVATMTVTKRKRVKVYKLHSYGRGQDEGATEFLEPPREKGTKMLKKGDEMWMYMPSVEKVQKLSGHMLRQGMMGSDVSYEDMLEAGSFREMYNGEVVGEETVEGRATWKLELAAKSEDVSYPRRVMWVDQATYIPLKQELYALSGMLLKTWTMTEITEVEGRQVAMRMEIADQLQEGSSTVLMYESITFKVALEDEIFSTRWLER